MKRHDLSKSWAIFFLFFTRVLWLLKIMGIIIVETVILNQELFLFNILS